MKQLLLFIILSLVVFSSCKVREHDFSAQSMRIDTLRWVSLRTDTFRWHDSIFVSERAVGETLRIEKHHFHTKYRTQCVYDTIYRHHTDTVRVREVQTVERKSKGNITPYIVVAIATAMTSIVLYRKYHG